MASKNFLNNYVSLGRLAHRLAMPLSRYYFRRTNRAYVLITRGRKVLLVKNWFGDGKWAMPGGGMKKHEGPEDAVIRELKEELGIEVARKGLRTIDQGRWLTDNLGHQYYVHHATSFTGMIKPDGREITAAEWIEFGSLTVHNSSPEILRALEKLPE